MTGRAMSVWRAALAGVMVAGLQTAACAAENLLRNAEFSELGPDGVPAGWEREHNPVLSGPFHIVDDRQAGRAACLMTEEWMIDRLQHIVQPVALPPGARAVELAARCRGQGFARLALCFTRRGQPLATVTNRPYFGTYVLPVETEHVFGLGPEYYEYRVRAEAPAEADGVKVVIGNTRRMANVNAWGTLLIASASLRTVDDADAPFPSSPYELLDKARPEQGLRDIARYARIATDPPCVNPELLRDGRTQDSWTPERFFLGGADRFGAVMLDYPEALPVAELCIHLSGLPSRLRVMGDPDGKGRYTELLAEVDGLDRGARHKWLRLELPGTPVFGLRIEPVQGLGLTGWRTPNQWLNEVQVHAPADKVKEIESVLRPWPRSRGIRVFEPGAEAAWAELLPSGFRAPDNADATRFGKEMWADLWMFGISAPAFADPEKAAALDVNDCVDGRAFRALCNGCKRMGFDTIDVFLEGVPVVNGKSIAAWESDVCESMRQNVLKAVIEGVQREGLKTTVDIWAKYGPPFFAESQYLCPQEETSRYPQIRHIPSIIHGDYVRENWGRMMDEILACGTDDINLMWHEGFYKGHFMETFPQDDPGRALYRERFGRELPAKEEDTLAFRQWIRMRHEGICDLFGQWTRELRRKYPEASLSAGTIMQAFAGHSYVTDSGVPLDLLCERADFDVIGTDYAGPLYMGMASAANGWRRHRMINDANLWGPVSGAPKKPDFDSYAEVLRSVMYGVGVISYYRYNYTVINRTAPGITRAMSMLRELEALGAYEARPPDDVAILFSRAGKDWWQIRSWWGARSGDPDFDRSTEGVRGWYAERVVFEILQENGIPLQCRYLDRPAALDELARHKVIAIPFAWSVGDAAVRKVKDAADKGAKILLFDGRMGETDEWGEPRDVPAFRELVESGKAVLFEEDIFETGATGVFAQKVIDAVNAAAAGDLPLKLNRNGCPRLEATVLEKENGERFLCMLNWDVDAARIDVGLRVPDGRYEVLVRDENQWLSMLIDRSPVVTPEQLASFKLQLEPRKPYVLFVRPVVE